MNSVFPIAMVVLVGQAGTSFTLARKGEVYFLDAEQRKPALKRKVRQDGRKRAEAGMATSDCQPPAMVTQNGATGSRLHVRMDLGTESNAKHARKVADKARDAKQSRRMLALAEIYRGQRPDAAGCRSCSPLGVVAREGPDGLIEGKPPDQPPKFDAAHQGGVGAGWSIRRTHVLRIFRNR